MNEITLREVCESFGVSRRAVQGYEKVGLVSATSKNRRGYLLYDMDAQERIKKIKLFQQMGFSVKDIARIIDAPNHVLRVALEERIVKLKEDNIHTQNMIDKAYEMIHHLNELR